MNNPSSLKLKELAGDLKYISKKGHTLPQDELFKYAHIFISCLSEMSEQIEYIANKIETINNVCQ